jgi:capsular polysaccharide biosynthesis protein
MTTLPAPSTSGRRRWRWVPTMAVAIVLAGTCGFLSAERQPDTFVSTTRLLAGPVNADRDTIDVAADIVRTYAELARSETVLASAHAAMGTPSSPSVTITADGDTATRVLEITVEGTDPTTSRATADALAGELMRLAPAAPSPAQLTVINPASPPVAGGTGPRPAALAAMAAAALAGLGLVLLIEDGRPRAATSDRLAQAAGAPVLAFRPPPAGSVGEPAQASVQALAIAAANALVGRIVVLGATPAPPTTEVARRLAALLSAEGASVVLVAAHRHRYGSVPMAGAELDQLRGDADVLIVDAGPVTGPVDALTLAAAADGTVLVATREPDAHRHMLTTVRDLRRASASLLAVLVCTSARWSAGRAAA